MWVSFPSGHIFIYSSPAASVCATLGRLDRPEGWVLGSTVAIFLAALNFVHKVLENSPLPTEHAL